MKSAYISLFIVFVFFLGLAQCTLESGNTQGHIEHQEEGYKNLAQVTSLSEEKVIDTFKTPNEERVDTSYLTSSILYDRDAYSMDSLWYINRVEYAKSGEREMLLIPIAKRDETTHCNCIQYFTASSSEVDSGLCLNLIFRFSKLYEKTERQDFYVIGYFTGYEEIEYCEQNVMKQYEFIVLNQIENPNPRFIIKPSIIAEKTYENVAQIKNITTNIYNFIYDADKYTRVFDNLPKAQHKLVHNESGIPVLFQSLELDESPREYYTIIEKDIQNYQEHTLEYNSKENSLFVMFLDTNTSKLTLLKKVFYPKEMYTLNVRIEIDPTQKSQALRILKDFDYQMIPFIRE